MMLVRALMMLLRLVDRFVADRSFRPPSVKARDPRTLTKYPLSPPASPSCPSPHVSTASSRVRAFAELIDAQRWRGPAGVIRFALPRRAAAVHYQNVDGIVYFKLRVNSRFGSFRFGRRCPYSPKTVRKRRS